MVKIIVLGHGLIPRNHGIAPKRSPFDADLNLINIIMATGSMSVSIINPVTGAAIPVNANNVNQIYRSMENMKAAEKKNKKEEHTLKPVVPVIEKTMEPINIQKPIIEEPKASVQQNQNDNKNYKNNNNKNSNNKNYNTPKTPELPTATTIES